MLELFHDKQHFIHPPTTSVWLYHRLSDMVYVKASWYQTWQYHCDKTLRGCVQSLSTDVFPLCKVTT